MRLVPLGDIANSTSDRAGAETLTPVYSVTKHNGFVRSDEYFSKQVFSRDLSNYKLVRQGHFAYATIHLDEGSIGVAPEDGLVSPMYTSFAADGNAVSNDYLIRYLKSPRALANYPALGKGSAERRRSISFHRLAELKVPLPPLEEQRRIAAILDKADELRTKRRQALAHLDTLTQSIFHTMFGDPAGSMTARLDDLCDVSSGITKGRKTSASELSSYPYLAVSNVQDRVLDMTVVKEIDVTAQEAERFRLQRDDLLLTEGGDPDKLGRGTLWNDELPWCLHQNHVFRVRPRTDVVPLYLSWYLASPDAKSYFFRMAKQTTGIASINKTQLSATPVKVPPLELQQTFATRVAAVERLKESHRKHLAELDTLFASLQHRAFKGEL